MVFSSLVFLCVFLPVVFLLDRAMPSVRAKNVVLIVASLLFYAYGEPVLVLLMLASTLFNYLMGRAVGSAEGPRRKQFVVVAIAVNLALLYVSFFPQLIAGPIVKYHDIERQMTERAATMEDVAVGLRRFVLGLSKKVLVANAMASVADALLALPANVLNAPGAWLAAFAYLMQIYFDFSGYSDMAIGLGRAFGFHFKENFDHPYASTTAKEFWRKWHMSLSTWLREYLYFPLGGNRKGRARAALNRVIVFFLCGLWHGASWTFVVWGLCHGMLLLLEDVVPLRKLPRALGHAYTILFVMITFVIFRCDTLVQAWSVISTMFVGWDLSTSSMIPVVQQLTPLFLLTAIVAVCLAGSLPQRVASHVLGPYARLSGNLDVIAYAGTFVLLALCLISLSSGTYNPFIYFRF